LGKIKYKGVENMFYWFGDWSFAIIIPGILLALIAQMLVRNAYNKYAKVIARSNITGAQVARTILDQNSVKDISVETTHGVLTDHFNIREKTIRLSDKVYNGNSISALGIAAHEAGHALQHAQGYGFLKVRDAILPVANIGSNLAFPLVIAGIIFESMPFLADIGLLLFAFVLLFQLITLPVELNASRRAMDALKCEGILSREEAKGARKVLTAAAFTYVAALLITLLNFIRLFVLSRRHN